MAGFLWISGDGDVRFYNPTGSPAVWRTTMMTSRDSILFDSTGGTYTRYAPHGVKVVFDTLGRALRTVDRLGRTTKFAYTTSTGLDLDHITLPVPNASDTTHYRYQFYYDTSSAYLDAVTAPGPTGGTWTVNVAHGTAAANSRNSPIRTRRRTRSNIRPPRSSRRS